MNAIGNFIFKITLIIAITSQLFACARPGTGAHTVPQNYRQTRMVSHDVYHPTNEYDDLYREKRPYWVNP